MKDGIIDKLSEYVTQLRKDGLVCQVVGAQVEALDTMHCDVCRLKYLTEMCMTSAFDLLSQYQGIVERRDARNH